MLGEVEGKRQLEVFLHKNQKARARLLAALLDQPEQDYDLLTKKMNVTRTVVRALEEQKLITLESEKVFRDPIRHKNTRRKTPEFTEEQQHAINIFREDYRRGLHKTYLVYGITGSGKTEVYMEMIAQVLKEGGQAIVLIPEIALTYQTVMRFYGRFGERVSILNSRMSPGERYDQMERVKSGQVDVMIGPRSALFTPFHARETAIERAKSEGASVVLGSATPSLEAFYACKCGHFQLLKLIKRAGEGELPKVYVEDMRKELREGNRSILSDRLKNLIELRLAGHEQIMLFLNRRGYAGFVSCRSCGYVVKCSHCDVSLAAHKGGRMICHYCGYEEPAVNICP